MLNKTYELVKYKVLFSIYLELHINTKNNSKILRTILKYLVFFYKYEQQHTKNNTCCVCCCITFSNRITWQYDFIFVSFYKQILSII